MGSGKPLSGGAVLQWAVVGYVSQQWRRCPTMGSGKPLSGGAVLQWAVVHLTVAALSYNGQWHTSQQWRRCPTMGSGTPLSGGAVLQWWYVSQQWRRCPTMGSGTSLSSGGAVLQWAVVRLSVAALSYNGHTSLSGEDCASPWWTSHLLHQRSALRAQKCIYRPTAYVNADLLMKLQCVQLSRFELKTMLYLSCSWFMQHSFPPPGWHVSICRGASCPTKENGQLAELQLAELQTKIAVPDTRGCQRKAGPF
ncbi:uncharacterized protein LOC134442673 isoform X1 [Engraulis encrasicolus]|uniref:uncharacterized protein LOC134442673 isoform X1 n=1 Tax=Engraulis encrasicolus TaxID=184585 RepID=UPI002FD74BB5